LYDSFDKSFDLHSNYVDIILGKTLNGESVTLYNCYESYRDLLNYTKSIYIINNIFIGDHFTNKDDLCFNAIKISFNNLETWIQYSELDPFDKIFCEGMELNIEIKQEKIFNLDQNSTFKILTQVFKERNFEPKFIHYYNKSDIILDSNIKKDFNILLNEGLFFSKLLTVFIQTYIYPLEISFLPSKNNNIKFYARFDYPINSNLIQTYNKILFPYKKISNIFSTIITKYYEIKDKIEMSMSSIYDFYFNVIRYDDNKFTNLVNSLESMHKNFRNPPIWSKKEFQENKNRILSKLDENEKGIFLNNFMVKNEPSIKERLIDIFTNCSDKKINNYIKNKFNNLDNYCNIIAKTRNAYTHKFSKKEDVLVGEDFMISTSILKVLLIKFILIEIGFDINYINDVFLNYRLFPYYSAL
jgi:hypothetical protein